MHLRVMDMMPDLTFELGGVEHDELVRAWRELHHLAQAVVEIGKSWGEYQDDDSHSALVIPEDGGSFTSPAADGEAAALLEMAGGAVTLSVGREPPSEMHTIFATGKTREQIAARVRALAEHALGKERQNAVPAPDLPDHPVANGAAFDFSDPGPSMAVDEHYAVTHAMLERFATALRDRAADGTHELVPRLWPHHFDLASLFVLERDSEGAMTKSIGVGLAPPDDLEPAGYWYVGPWSAEEPRAMEKPDLPLGRWVERGPLAMGVLPISEVWKIVDDDALYEPVVVQAAAIAEFATLAFNACVDALGG